MDNADSNYPEKKYLKECKQRSTEVVQLCSLKENKECWGKLTSRMHDAYYPDWRQFL